MKSPVQETLPIAGGVDPEFPSLPPPKRTISFVVRGEPKPQPRARSFALRGKGGRVILDKRGQPIIRVHEAGTAENWKSQIALAAKDHCQFLPILGPVSVNILFWMPRPKAHFKTCGAVKPNAPTWHTGRGDVDNMFKAVTDSLTTLGMWKDDGQISQTTITKRYGLQPGAEITIVEL